MKCKDCPQVGVTVHTKIHVPARYINELLHLKCALDWWPFLAGVPAKEVTESLAVFTALQKLVGVKAFADDRWIAVVPGDGRRARTAALVALRTRWRAFSIDPDADGEAHGVERLSIILKKLEALDVQDRARLEAPCIAALAVHSHAPLEPLLSLRCGRLVVVALPCCVSQHLPFPHEACYEDRSVWSEKNTVIVWDLRNAGSGWVSSDTVIVNPDFEDRDNTDAWLGDKR